MISNTPNLRFVKPLSKYMQLRIRMYGRQRFANTYSVTGANLNIVTLPFTPGSPETLEIYLDSVRVIGGYNVNGREVRFTPPLAGRMDFVDDDVVVDMGQKWLPVPLPNLLQSNDTQNTAYGTDRRAGQQIATHAQPVCITQGAIGFCRPSPDNDQLLYCPYYGMYGRDSITYAIKTDLGQLSDFRCIDIRVRDPSYIPTMRLACISAVSNPVQVDGVLKDIVPNGYYQIYADILTGKGIQLPNKDGNGPREYHFVIQGQDENGDWFEPEEYFDPGSFEIIAETQKGFTVTFIGSAEDYGFANATRVSVMTDFDGEELPIKLRYMDTDLLSVKIASNKPIPLETYPIEAADPLIELDYGGAGTATWIYNDDWISEDGINLDMLWENPVFEERDVSVAMSFAVQFSKYVPSTGLTTMPIPYAKTVNGKFITAENKLNNEVVQPEDTQETLITGLFWETSNQFSPVYEGNLVLNSTFDWQIVVATP